MATYKKRTIPQLSDRMRNAGATNEALATVSGVSRTTIARARTGVAIQFPLAAYIEQALDTKEFQRDRRGAR